MLFVAGVLGYSGYADQRDIGTAHRLKATGISAVAYDAELTTTRKAPRTMHVRPREDIARDAQRDVSEVSATVYLRDGTHEEIHLTHPQLHGRDDAEDRALRANYDGTFDVLFDPEDENMVMAEADVERLLAGSPAATGKFVTGVVGIVVGVGIFALGRATRRSQGRR
ncbi:hypothetical protein [Antribacter gilvus]|uniref:hypothetical protein n=1 Tax=Antribacter gilvus TaxID=2304675 RepID=UPI000F770B65|nr:hypothetical protein [Antribacter gilvus]